MTNDQSPGVCQVCGKSFTWYARKHPDCERNQYMHQLSAQGALAAELSQHLAAGWSQIQSVPTLYRINGCGTTLLGMRDEGMNNTATFTQYFTFLWVPVLPLTQYRVVRLSDEHFNFIAQHSPDSMDWKRAAKVWILLLVLFVAWRWFFA